MCEKLDWVNQEIEKRPRTIAHHDLRADNLLFGPAGSPEEVVILDWQLALRSMGAWDVAKVMSGSELPVERHGHQIDVLRAWHETLLANGVDNYSWDDALRDLRLGALSLLANPVHFHRGMIGATGRKKQLGDAMFRRLFASAVEMGVESLF